MKIAQHALAGKVEPKEIISSRYNVREEIPCTGFLFFTHSVSYTGAQLLRRVLYLAFSYPLLELQFLFVFVFSGDCVSYY